MNYQKYVVLKTKAGFIVQSTVTHAVVNTYPTQGQAVKVCEYLNKGTKV